MQIQFQFPDVETVQRIRLIQPQSKSGFRLPSFQLFSLWILRVFFPVLRILVPGSISRCCATCRKTNHSLPWQCAVHCRARHHSSTWARWLWCIAGTNPSRHDTSAKKHAELCIKFFIDNLQIHVNSMNRDGSTCIWYSKISFSSDWGDSCTELVTWCIHINASKVSKSHASWQADEAYVNPRLDHWTRWNDRKLLFQANPFERCLPQAAHIDFNQVWLEFAMDSDLLRSLGSKSATWTSETVWSFGRLNQAAREFSGSSVCTTCFRSERFSTNGFWLLCFGCVRCCKGVYWSFMSALPQA